MPAGAGQHCWGCHGGILPGVGDSSCLTFPARSLLNDPTYALIDSSAKAPYVNALVNALTAKSRVAVGAQGSIGGHDVRLDLGIVNDGG